MTMRGNTLVGPLLEHLTHPPYNAHNPNPTHCVWGIPQFTLHGRLPLNIVGACHRL